MTGSGMSRLLPGRPKMARIKRTDDGLGEAWADGALGTPAPRWHPHAKGCMLKAMTEGSDNTLAWMRRLGAKLDRMLAALEVHTCRLQWVEGRLTSLAAQFAVIETFDQEIARFDQRLDKHGRRLARVEDVTVLAEPSP